MCGMLLLAVLAPTLPPLPLRLLKAAPEAEPAQFTVPPAAQPRVPSRAPAPRPPALRFDWSDAAAAVYALGVVAFLARLAMGYAFVHRLVRAARPQDGIY